MDLDYLSITIQQYKEYMAQYLLHKEYGQESHAKDFLYYQTCMQALHGLLLNFGVTQYELGLWFNEIKNTRLLKSTDHANVEA